MSHVPVIDMVGTYCQADQDCYSDLPYIIREYMRGMVAAPRAAIVLESVRVAGTLTTLDALRERDMLERLQVH